MPVSALNFASTSSLAANESWLTSVIVSPRPASVALALALVLALDPAADGLALSLPHAATSSAQAIATATGRVVLMIGSLRRGRRGARRGACRQRVRPGRWGRGARCC